ncbi:hypothetical protein [Desulfuribacillus alkaliarsenatis]|uniref:Uncharacterized protein n=1 Tax=Desulfuribacillus alkaliarsenatis TaxID=766136 RepID=A0A1E5G4U6_9FIRM|nr:hypothetical protein [Desulfuribacillus alkaliarsenatis]OEF98196.1 hypothetical protein BHF68_00460 [Desulfuribacillus alkaliarsenatis]
MLILVLLIISALVTVWSMIEIVSPRLVFKLYQRVGFLQMPEKSAIRLIRIDGVISWLIFSIVTGYLYGKL